MKIFDTGKGKASSAINYLIGDKDHTGKIRSVKPEIIAGDAKITEQLIDSCTRELKYKSGVVAFGNHEKPTQEQIEKVIFNFEKSFLQDSRKMKTSIFYGFGMKIRTTLSFIFLPP